MVRVADGQRTDTLAADPTIRQGRSMTPTPPPASKPCAATTVAGSPCPNPARLGSPYCGLHDPAVAKQARVAGGRARAASQGRPLALLTEEQAGEIRLAAPEAVPPTLERIARWAATGTLDARIANCLAILAGNCHSRR